MLLSLAFVFAAHADYFELDQRFRREDSERARAESLVRHTQEADQHNADLQAVVTAFARDKGGAYNLQSRGCGNSYCSTPIDFDYRLQDRFIDTITFTTGQGYECYARLWPAGREISCLHPETRDRIYIDPLSNGRLPGKKKHRSRADT